MVALQVERKATVEPEEIAEREVEGGCPYCCLSVGNHMFVRL